MPNDDFVSKALAGAKNALAGAKKFTASTGDTDPSKVVAKPASAVPAAKPAAPSGLNKEASDVKSGLEWRAKQVKEIGQMKEGGKVPKTGLYKMHKGEDVVTADKSNLQEVVDRAKDALGGPKRPKHGMRNMRVDHHTDGSHTVHHMPHEGEEISYAVKNHAELADKIKQYLGDEQAEGETPEKA